MSATGYDTVQENDRLRNENAELRAITANARVDARRLTEENADLKQQLERWITRMRMLEDKIDRIRSIVAP